MLAQYEELRPKTHASRNLTRVALRHYWEIFKRKDPPLWVIRIPRKPRMVCRALTDEEAGRLAAVARADGTKKGLAVLLAMYQGLRREEIAKVRWDDITDDGWLRLVG